MTPEEEAQHHLHHLDSLPIEGEFKCVCCGQRFYEGQLCDSVDEICDNCFDNNRHLLHYQTQGLTDRDIYYELTFKQL